PGDATDRPNVLFLIADDLNNCLGCYGDPRVKTPNIDRLAARGVRFDRAYCQFPLCGPSRNCLLTGLYPNSTGILANSQIFRQTIPTRQSLPQALRLQNYFAARVGKLYHYNVPNSIGTNGHDDPGSWELEMNPAGVDRLEEMPHIFSLVPFQFGGTLSWYASPKSDEFHTDAIQAENAEWILERCAKRTDRPFFLAVGFFRPHTPYVSPKKYFDLYQPEEMPIVRGVKEDQADIPKAALASYKKEQDQLTEELTQQCIQAYYASISFMDTQVGRVLDALDRLKLSDNTIVVFTSDHGYHLGEHGLWQKMSLFEESARVPLLIALPPKLGQPGVVKTPVSHIDIYPTITELCGVESQKPYQGQSLVPILKNNLEAGRGWALTQVLRPGSMPTAGQSEKSGRPLFGFSLRTPRWRYTEWDEGRHGRELYDHDHDSRELTNLGEAPEHSQTIATLSSQLKDAVNSSYPESGKIPEIKPGLWAPLLVDPPQARTP
ncbi:MAG: sulfatase, partial [Planctomycetes bacterium]|nr:sulfatase [Planctomycetota bacterium]